MFALSLVEMYQPQHKLTYGKFAYFYNIRFSSWHGTQAAYIHGWVNCKLWIDILE